MRGRGYPTPHAVRPVSKSELLGGLLPDATVLRVAGGFLGIFVLLEAIVWIAVSQGWVEPTLIATATLTGRLANATGVSATVVGNDVLLATRTLRIDPDCTGITLVVIYVSLILAYPLSARQKLFSVALGVPLLLLTNVLRLLAVAYLSGFLGQDAFMFVHDYLFMIGMVFVIVGLWGLSLVWVRRHVA